MQPHDHGLKCKNIKYKLTYTVLKRLLHPGKADPYGDIDFEEINEQTNLANDEIKCLKVSLKISIFVLTTFLDFNKSVQ